MVERWQITDYLEAQNGQKRIVDTEGEEQVQEEREQLTLGAIRQVIAQEFGKIEGQLQQFKDEIFKTLESTEHKIDAKLLKNGQKIDLLEKS